MQMLMGIGVYVWGAIYILGVIAAGLALGCHGALYLALTSAGLAYLAQVAGFTVYDQGSEGAVIVAAWWANVAATLTSALSGIVAGLLLIAGI